jgi:CRP/FNR family transcriptional regulator, cyclic AMP receptor protein
MAAMTSPNALPALRSSAESVPTKATIRTEWHDGTSAETVQAPIIKIKPQPSTPRRRRRVSTHGSALFMSEGVEELNIGAHFLDRLSGDERARLHDLGRPLVFRQGETVFNQGERHDGIFVIGRGQVRVYYTAPSGREITLAYWTPGHFIGGPEICGGGAHMWSGVAVDDCRITQLPSPMLEKLLTQMPNFALALIDGLVAKGKCYSSMAQMLGTRSVIERLAQYLLNLSELYGSPEGDSIVINYKVTHDQIAAMVGSTRQWVTMMLKRFQSKGIVAIEGSIIRIERLDLLEHILFMN